MTDPITQFRDSLEVEEKQVGEIAVKAELATEHYYNNREADLLAKIPDRDGGFWHRMGDLAWKDSQGRIWFCGRKAHRVETGKQSLYTIPVEAIFNNHDKVYRSALTGVGPKDNQIPVMFIEPKEKITDEKTFVRELFDLAKQNPLTAGIEHIFIDPRISCGYSP